MSHLHKPMQHVILWVGAMIMSDKNNEYFAAFGLRVLLQQLFIGMMNSDGSSNNSLLMGRNLEEKLKIKRTYKICSSISVSVTDQDDYISDGY